MRFDTTLTSKKSAKSEEIQVTYTCVNQLKCPTIPRTVFRQRCCLALLYYSLEISSLYLISLSANPFSFLFLKNHYLTWLHFEFTYHGSWFADDFQLSWHVFYDKYEASGLLIIWLNGTHALENDRLTITFLSFFGFLQKFCVFVYLLLFWKTEKRYQTKQRKMITLVYGSLQKRQNSPETPVNDINFQSILWLSTD